MSEIENVIIIGSGPAGYTAALYTSRADLEPLVIEGFLWGGLLQQTTDVENYPGFPEGDDGPGADAAACATRPSASARASSPTRPPRWSSSDGRRRRTRVCVGDDEHLARAVILAMGAEPKKLGVPGEEELAARGVSYCATCDAAFFRDKPTIVVGGGDTAMEDAIFLAKFASKVDIVHRRDEFRASQIMLERARAIENIEFMTPYAVERFEPGEDGALGQAVLRNAETARARSCRDRRRLHRDRPPAELAASSRARWTPTRAATCSRRASSTRTNRPGVFAAGDLVDHIYRQAVTAAGTGCQAGARRRVVPARPPGLGHGQRGTAGRRGEERSAQLIAPVRSANGQLVLTSGAQRP